MTRGDLGGMGAIGTFMAGSPESPGDWSTTSLYPPFYPPTKFFERILDNMRYGALAGFTYAGAVESA